MIVTYDRNRSAGLIKPDLGGALIVFGPADQPRLHPEPELFQRYSYNVLTPRDGGQARAVNLCRQQTHREQAEAQPR